MDPSPKKNRKPSWLKRRLPAGPAYEQTRRLLKQGSLHTVCQEAHCPNVFECFSKHTATFLILGDRCTRNCRFCAVAHGPEGPPDPMEPERVAEAAVELGLSYVVITSVTRDDLSDGGAGVFADVIRAIRKRSSELCVEVLIPDFNGRRDALFAVLDAGPDVLNHNIETVPRLYPDVRPQADYRQSLKLLERARRYRPEIPTKSGIMLGLGETDEEVLEVLNDLRKASCRVVTIGQYLQPTADHLPVKRFVTPEQFEVWRKTALRMGFDEAPSGPFVRSSYHARDSFEKLGGEDKP